MKVLSLISTKGGAGETTVVTNLVGLPADTGLKVLLLDLDIQPTLSSYYAPCESSEAGSYELISQRLTAADQIISITTIPRLELIVSNDRAGHIGSVLLHAPDGRLRLRNLLPALEGLYDVLIINIQGARSVVVEMVILASDCALCPVPPEVLAARELRRSTLGLFEELEPYRYPGVAFPSLKLLLNQVNANRRDTRLIMHSLQASFQGDVHVRLSQPCSNQTYLPLPFFAYSQRQFNPACERLLGSTPVRSDRQKSPKAVDIPDVVDRFPTTSKTSNLVTQNHQLSWTEWSWGCPATTLSELRL